MDIIWLYDTERNCFFAHTIAARDPVDRARVAELDRANQAKAIEPLLEVIRLAFRLVIIEQLRRRMQEGDE